MSFPVLLSSLFCVYTLIPVSVVGQIMNGTFPAGRASLTAGRAVAAWRSPSGDFAFGFHYPVDGTDRYLLSIWYDNIPEQTIVWYPTDTDRQPIEPVASGSKLLLTADEGLLLTDPQGTTLWESQITATGAVVYGVMNDTGNFQLTTGTGSGSSLLWQSFDHPADTLLPGQTFDRDDKEMLLSRHKENNFTRGRFQLRLLQNGNLVLNSINLPTKFAYDAYYKSGTDDSANPGDKLVYNNSGYLYILRVNDGERFDLTQSGTVQSVDGYHRATLNFDGVFRQYFYQKQENENGSWSSIWYKPDNICSSFGGLNIGSGVCGFNNICNLEDNGRPVCNCPRGFSQIDQNDEYGSCKPDTEISCGDDQTYRQELYEVEERPNINWPTGDYARLTPSNEEDCRADCLSDCLCSVAIFGGNTCWKKKLPLSNGMFLRTGDTRAFIKFKKSTTDSSDDPLPTPNDVLKESSNGLLITVSALLGTSVFVNFMLITASCIGFLFIYQKKLFKLRMSGELDTNVQVFTYRELVEVTNNFKEQLGSGAFGVVYKGKIKIGSTLTWVAVKKLDRLVTRDHDKKEEFKTEVKVIGQVHHKNLVRLLGICEEGDQRLLVYEFLSNGTLADFLFGDSNTKPSWNQRIQIAFGIARGLLYLHEECSSKIIHCDIKPQNILLDNYYNARISDFGLAKLLKMDQTQIQTGIRGTKGYVAPEWFKSSPVTTKVDVYSFGVILLEIICCRRNVDIEKGEAVGAILTDLACDCYEEGTTMELVKDDLEAMSDVKMLERFILVAIWCIQENPSVRPTMRKVNQMLEGVVQLTLPPLPSKN